MYWIYANEGLLRGLNGSQGFALSRLRKGRGKGGKGSIRQQRLASEVKWIDSTTYNKGLVMFCGLNVSQGFALLRSCKGRGKGKEGSIWQ